MTILGNRGIVIQILLTPSGDRQGLFIIKSSLLTFFSSTKRILYFRLLQWSPHKRNVSHTTHLLFVFSSPPTFSPSAYSLLPPPPPPAADLSSDSGFHLFVRTLPFFIISSGKSSSAANTVPQRSASHVWPCSTNLWSDRITPPLTHHTHIWLSVCLFVCLLLLSMFHTATVTFNGILNKLIHVTVTCWLQTHLLTVFWQ